MAGLDAGELGLDTEHEQAVAELAALDEQLAELRREELAAAQDRAALAARVEALHVGLNRKDASSALLAATDQLDGLLGSVAVLVSVEATYEKAVAAAFGSAADAVARRRASMPRSARSAISSPRTWAAPACCWAARIPSRSANGRRCRPPAARYAIEVVEVPTELTGAVRRVLRKVAVVEDLPAAQSLVAALPDVVAVTRDGDVLSTHFAAGGSSAQPSLIEVQAAIDDAEAAVGRGEPQLRAAAVRPEPAGRPASRRCRRPSRWPWPGCTSRTPRWPRWPRNSAS